MKETDKGLNQENRQLENTLIHGKQGLDSLDLTKQKYGMTSQ